MLSRPQQFCACTDFRSWHKASVRAVQGHVRSWGKADLPVERHDFSV
jgi:hypothetical protein